MERTIRFYQDLLEFPLTELFENRDYKGSNHFFFDIGNGNWLAFFDFPGLDVGPYARRCSGACTTSRSRSTPERWEHLKSKLDEAGVEYLLESKVSIYFTDPDGARLELLADPLGEMYGRQGPLGGSARRPLPPGIEAKISLQAGQTGNRFGSRPGIHFFPHSAVTLSPESADSRIFSFFT